MAASFVGFERSIAVRIPVIVSKPENSVSNRSYRRMKREAQVTWTTSPQSIRCGIVMCHSHLYNVLGRQGGQMLRCAEGWIR